MRQDSDVLPVGATGKVEIVKILTLCQIVDGMPNIELLNDPAGFNLAEHMKAEEAAFIREALFRADGNKAKAAELLGMRRTTLLEKMRKHGFDLLEPYRKTLLEQLGGDPPAVE